MKTMLITDNKIKIVDGLKVRTYKATPKNVERVKSLRGMVLVDWGGAYRYEIIKGVNYEV